MAENTVEIKTPQATQPEKPRVSGHMARLARRAERELAKSSQALDDAAPTGLASHNTLETRGFVSGPQGGEKLPRQSAPRRYKAKQR